MPESIRILHVEDDRDFAAMTAEFLEREHDDFEVLTETDPAEAIDRLRAESIDCVVSDYEMSGIDGLEYLDRVRAVDETIPFILFTGRGSESVASEALARGATDYLQKSGGPERFAVLANRIENTVVQHRSLAELDRQRRLLETAHGIADIAVWEYDVETGESWFSRGSGWHFSSADAAPFDLDEALENFAPVDRPRLRSAFETALEEAESFDLEVRRDVSGERRWIHVRGEPEVEAGTVTSVCATLQDVTERVERRRELERYETLVEAVGDGIVAIDAEAESLHVNQAVVEMSGYDREDIVETGPRLWHDEADLRRLEAAVDALRAAPAGSVETIEATLRTADGGDLPIEVTLTLTSGDAEGFPGLVGVVRDVSSRREREQELEEYETILRAIPDEVVMIDTEGVITSVIPPTGSDRTATGYRPEELEGEHMSTVLRSEDVERGRSILEGLTNSDDDRTSFELDLIARDGDPLVRESHVALLETDDGAVRGTVSVLRDITERKRYERELERQNERLAEFAEVVSHELRNPLSVASGRLELARENPDEAHFQRIADALDRMERLIDDTMTMARDGDPVTEIRSVDLEGVVAACWEGVATSDATLEVTEPMRVRADPDRLRQVVENLLRNAVEHGGEDVSVRVGPVGDRGFFVEDDGPGLSTDDGEAVFAPGYSTGTDGTGFGLAIVEEIAHAHDWTVEATEGDLGGARFVIGQVAVERPTDNP